MGILAVVTPAATFIENRLRLGHPSKLVVLSLYCFCAYSARLFCRALINSCRYFSLFIIILYKIFLRISAVFFCKVSNLDCFTKVFCGFPQFSYVQLQAKGKNADSYYGPLVPHRARAALGGGATSGLSCIFIHYSVALRAKMGDRDKNIGGCVR